MRVSARCWSRNGMRTSHRLDTGGPSGGPRRLELDRLAFLRLHGLPAPGLRRRRADDRLHEQAVRVAEAALGQVLGRLDHLGRRIESAVELERADRATLGTDDVEREVAPDAARRRVLPAAASVRRAVA